MPQRRLPKSNPARDNALTLASGKLATIPAVQNPLTTGTTGKLGTLQPIYHALIVALNLARFNQTMQTGVLTPLRHTARLWLSHGYQALINACIRGQFPHQVKNLYGLPVNALGAPPMDKDADLLNAATTYNDGENGRVATGGDPISFPSQADITTHVSAFRAGSDQQSTLKDIYDAAQEALEAENNGADQLILRLWNEIETAYDTGDKPSMRRKAREWGVVYVPSPGEPLSPDDYSVIGAVTNALTSLPLASVEVILENGSTSISHSTDADGKFYMPPVDPGSYTIRVEFPGFMPYSMPVTVIEGEVLQVGIILTPETPPAP